MSKNFFERNITKTQNIIFLATLHLSVQNITLYLLD